MQYILEGKTPVACNSVDTWGKWMQKTNRAVAKTAIGDVLVSTVFLGLDHNFGGGAPLLFETMIFGGVHDQYQDRCSTWEQAEVMHKEAVDLVES